ncbi:DUF6421 family protein [Longivirga aurantiaca]|uniref:DUF6421 family protein n=1 Tax=Longivirga aurantiaca TaxID=1837743 RepID=A0ABW1T2P0_9ACTN
MTTTYAAPASALATSAAWLSLKAAVEDLRAKQAADGSIPDAGAHACAAHLVEAVVAGVETLSPELPHDKAYHVALVDDLRRWAAEGFGTPDFLDSLVAFDSMAQRADGLEHLVLFPMLTQNGSTERKLEAVLLSVFWPEWVARIEAEQYRNDKFVPVTFTDFTAGYDTHSAVLFPETVAVREVPSFEWGAIFCDREAARFRRVIGAAVETLRIELPADAAPLFTDQRVAQETFVLWDLVHDRAHMRGDLPFDPFLVKQRLPYWLYAIEELRCDLTAFRAAVALEKQGVEGARRVQYAVILDRCLRFPVSGTRNRNYDSVGGQLLFAALRREGALSWSDATLTIDWDRVAVVAEALLARIEDLYRTSIDRNKASHWQATYDLVSEYVEPHVASTWQHGLAAMGPQATTKEYNDSVLPDEFPLSMFFEILAKKVSPVVESARGIRA